MYKILFMFLLCLSAIVVVSDELAEYTEMKEKYEEEKRIVQAVHAEAEQAEKACSALQRRLDAIRAKTEAEKTKSMENVPVTEEMQNAEQDNKEE